MTPKIDSSVKKSIIKLHGENYSIRKIADDLKLSKSAVGRVLKNFNDTGKVLPPKKNGRPRITSPSEDELVKKMALNDRFQTAASISREIHSSHDIKASRKTVSRRLNEIGLFTRSPAKKPLISNKNKKLRLSFAQEHVLWTDDQWQNSFFSDEIMAVVLLQKLRAANLTQSYACEQGISQHSLECCRNKLQAWEIREQDTALQKLHAVQQTEYEITIKDEFPLCNLEEVWGRPDQACSTGNHGIKQEPKEEFQDTNLDTETFSSYHSHDPHLKMGDSSVNNADGSEEDNKLFSRELATGSMTTGSMVPNDMPLCAVKEEVETMLFSEDEDLQPPLISPGSSGHYHHSMVDEEAGPVAKLNSVRNDVSPVNTETLSKENYLKRTSPHEKTPKLQPFYDDPEYGRYKDFICPYCSYRTNLQIYLEVHLEYHSAYQNGIFGCTDCTFQSENQLAFELHLKNEHKKGNILQLEQQNVPASSSSHATDIEGKRSKKKPHHECAKKSLLYCDSCIYSTHDAADLKRHLQTHLKDKRFSCNVCSFKSYHKGALQIHIKNHLKDASRKRRFSCEYCSYQTVRRDYFMKHSEGHIRRNVQYICSFCSYQTDDKFALERHVRIHDSNRTYAFHCPGCDYKSNLKKHLEHHMRWNHQDSEPFLNCQWCKFKAESRSDLTRHMRKHDFVRLRPFACNKCEFRTNSRESLKQHTCDHNPSQEKPFACHLCQYRTDEKSVLKEHLMGHYKHQEKTSCNDNKASVLY